ncbi:UDP-2,4-diacetamido-2,4,6-trideoxy-beta-L-altropyranose hydrolase [Ornithinibacillus scapharcae]|uniref:UDP-2,4-diacetamido-2,4, 6-trideoxy-beta-L-altropyranose hydrolase n=1 Tax=Ornithinibacillus scapharcae TaxID=1147159 RepID=UPI000225C000|nr:UDP-2,4-diacetamido-2,4,6-trideoxy-beta-L-altropyranose hydrolase [Ornithinibacillus scapharcae]
MHVVFRVDASLQIGTGHVRRCLTLAKELLERNVKVSFISRNLDGNLLEDIKKCTDTIIILPKLESNLNELDWYRIFWEIDAQESFAAMKSLATIDWLVVDHYGLDYQWEKWMKSLTKNILVIDDLANRAHDCQILLDQNLLVNMDSRYDGLVSSSTIQLLGPSYLLLEKDYNSIEAIQEMGEIQRVLVSFGGSDPTGETKKVIQALTLLDRKDIQYDVVIGKFNPDREYIVKHTRNMNNIVIFQQVPSLAPLMKKADLTIGAGGMTAWERIAMCLPSITIETANNQSDILNYLSMEGAIHHLGKSEDVTIKQIFLALQQLLDNPILINKMVKACIKIKDNFFITNENRVIKLLTGEVQDE